MEIDFEDPSSGFFIRDSTSSQQPSSFRNSHHDVFNYQSKGDSGLPASKGTNNTAAAAATEEEESLPTTSIVIGSSNVHYGKANKESQTNILQTSK